MRMTQELAKNISIKLMEKKRKEEKVLFDAYRKYVYDEYQKTIPKDVSACFKKYPEYFDTTGSIFLSGHGFNYESVAVPDGARAIENYGGRANLKDDKDVFSKAQELKRAYEKMKKYNNELQTEISSTLSALRTFAQVQKNLPEAVPYLPKSTSVELIVNLDGLRRKIKEPVGA